MRADPDGLRAAARRLTIQFTVLIATLFVIVAAIAVALLAASQHQALLQQVMNAQHLSSPAEAPPGVFVAIGGPGGPGDLAVSPHPPTGFPDQAAFDAAAKGSAPVQQNVTLGGRTYLMSTANVGGRPVQVAVDTSESAAELNRVLLSLGIAGVLALVGAVVASWWMSRRAMRPLADALALQRRFVADAGHELRTPLTLVSTRAQLLRRSLPDEPAPPVDAEPVRIGLDEIVAETKSLTGILEDLLIAADPRKDIDRAPVDLALVADGVVGTMLPEAGQRELSLTRAGDTDVIVSGVAVSLSRLVAALVANALDHATASVTVTVVARGREAWIDVGDDGPGFPSDVADRAFERFANSRSDDPAASGARHYGLGLALVAEVAQRLGGSVGIVDDAPGALVRVRLPLLRVT